MAAPERPPNCQMAPRCWHPVERMVRRAVPTLPVSLRAMLWPKRLHPSLRLSNGLHSPIVPSKYHRQWTEENTACERSPVLRTVQPKMMEQRIPLDSSKSRLPSSPPEQTINSRGTYQSPMFQHPTHGLPAHSDIPCMRSVMSSLEWTMSFVRVRWPPECLPTERYLLSGLRESVSRQDHKRRSTDLRHLQIGIFLLP